MVSVFELTIGLHVSIKLISLLMDSSLITFELTVFAIAYCH